MRNILMTVMMILVVVLLFVNIVSGTGGVKEQIQTQGTNAKTKISSLTP
ncbi:hypothetical protein [Marinicrinis lubricantis]|uniref:Preprotein translocase subunit SecG n=1 Tax=Marinicrinis lubricantis TaxID=2086470 RepID=A0ABW1IJH3_9BACL